MKKNIIDEKNGLDYTLIHGVYLPNLISTETHYEISYWGQQHIDYLMKYHKVFYALLKMSCKLNLYLHEVDVRAIVYNEVIYTK